jgi:hypothetical protein
MAKDVAEMGSAGNGEALDFNAEAVEKRGEAQRNTK